MIPENSRDNIDSDFFVGSIPLLPRIRSEADMNDICSFTKVTPAQDKELGCSGVIKNSNEVYLKLSRVIKLDVRLNFIRRFMSALNSGDMTEVEDFSRTFIRPDAPLNIWFHNDEALCIPKYLCGIGPRAHILYMLGCFTMFPDLVVKMGQTQLITSKCWTGTKIILPWQCLMTKTHHISEAWWIPPDPAVEWLNTQQSAMDRLLDALSLQNAPTKTQHQHADADEARATNYPYGTKRSKNKHNRRVRGLQLSKVEPNSPLQLVPPNVARKIQDSAVLFIPTPQLWAHGAYDIMLDVDYHVTSITLSGTQERLTGTKALI